MLVENRLTCGKMRLAWKIDLLYWKIKKTKEKKSENETEKIKKKFMSNKPKKRVSWKKRIIFIKIDRKFEKKSLKNKKKHERDAPSKN